MPVFNNVLAGAAGQGGAGDYTIERSLRFDDAATSELVRLPSSGGDRRTFTISFWLKRTKIGATQMLLQTGDTYNDLFRLYFDGNDKFRFHGYNGSSYIFDYISTARFRDVGAWGHYVVSIDTNAASGQRVKAYFNGKQITEWDTSNEPYQQYQTGWNAPINQRIGREYTSTYGNYYNFNGYVAEFHNVDGQALDPTNFGEFSADTGAWNPIRYSGSYGTNGFHLDFADASNLGNDAAGSNNFTATNLTGTVPSIASPNLPGWGNPDSNWNLSNQVNSNYLTATYSGSGTYKGVTSNILAANTTYHFFLEQYAGSNDSYSGWFFVDASSAPSNTVPDELSGDTLGQRVGENYAGYYGSYATANGGTNGQDKIDLTSIRANTSAGSATFSEWVINTSVNKVWVRAVGASGWIGGGNPATTSSTPSFNLSNATNKRFGYMGWGSGTYAKFLSSAGSPSDIDSLFDSPTNYDDGTNIGGNYATLNPLHNGQTLSNGNLDVVGGSSWQRSVSTIAMSSGQWYWEYEITASNEHLVGVGTLDMQMSGNLGAGSPPGSGYGTELGFVNGTGANSAWTNTGQSSTGDLIGVAFDADAGNMYIYKNGTALNSGIPSHTGLTSGPYYAVFSLNGSSRSGSVNFGQRPFKYPPGGTGGPPSDYKSLCTQSFDDPLIADPSTAFNTTLYTGDGNARDISTPYSPDLVWIKSRSAAYDHGIFDTVRGANQRLCSNSNGAEGTEANSVTAFNDDGFSLGSLAFYNNPSTTYAAWNWDGGNLVTNSAYNQTNTWSSSSSFASSTGFRSSEPETNAFDGNTNTICSAVGSGVVTFTSPVTFSSSSTIKVFVHGGDHTVSVNGGTDQTVSAGSLQTITFSNPSASTFTITFQRVGSSDTGIRAIEIGGKLLVDPGVIPVGGLNSSVYDQRQTWSSYITSSNGWGDGPDHTFDGVVNGSGGSYSNGGGATLTYTHPVAETVTSLRLRLYSTCNVSLGGGTAQSIAGVAGTGGWTTVDVGSGFAFTGSNTMTIARSSGYVYIDGIEINGKELIDSNVTPPNIPAAACTVRANPTAGFSIVKVDNPNSTESRAHGLNKKPDFIIGKALTGSQQWHIYHSALGKDYYGTFQTNAFSSSDQWGSKEPDSNLFYVKSNTGSGANFAGGMIYYIWTAIENYSAFGSYTGSSSFPFAYCGFRPALIVVKDATSSGWFHVHDTSRDPHNVSGARLFWGDSIAEQENDSAYGFDIVSNGFKLRNTHSESNTTNETYVWAAWAENPFKYARAR